MNDLSSWLLGAGWYALDFMALASWMPIDFLGILCNSNEKGDESLSSLLAEMSTGTPCRAQYARQNQWDPVYFIHSTD